MTIKRNAIAALSLSAAALVGLLAHEGYSDRAIIPVKGDRPTVGFGSTFRDDGSPVQMGDTITPPRAVARTYAHIEKDEAGIKSCVTAPVLQKEYDLLVKHSYQYGAAVTCRSPMVRHINAGNYLDACAGYLSYRYMTSRTPIAGYEAYQYDAAGKPTRWRFDCATPGNRVCGGVWTRSKELHRQCIEAQP